MSSAPQCRYRCFSSVATRREIEQRRRAIGNRSPCCRSLALSENKSDAYFADGVQDQILTNLAKVSDLKVISHTSVRQYKTGAERNMREIGQQLGVAYIMEGSVRRDRDRLRINAQLIDARTDAHIWAETYDRTAADLFAIQSELAQSIVTQLKATLSPQQKAEIEERPTQDLDAFELYLQAKPSIDSYLNATDVRAALLQALKSLEEATQRDPNFVSAYCYAARANDLLFFFDLDPSQERVSLADAAVKAALQLLPNSAEAHFAQGRLLLPVPPRLRSRPGRAGDRAVRAAEQHTVLYSLRLHQSSPQPFCRRRTRFLHRVRTRSAKSECLQSSG